VIFSEQIFCTSVIYTFILYIIQSASATSIYRRKPFKDEAQTALFKDLVRTAQ